MKLLASEWLKAAQDDLAVIEKIINEESLSHMVAFHAQQCIEKSLKALGEERSLELPKIHKLKTLASRVGIDLSSFENGEDHLHLLDELYIDSRYPGDFGLLPNGKPTLEDAQEFYRFAKSIYLTVQNTLNQ
ncbi:HEPN domain-containing protein [Sulfuricurvum sp.]|uniref:HEPN domain-containing protein n=1 Tax=Sulfuricurvum sp. TaxID=2025608 RepID=UPI00260B2401|nr:HEPN domain-containing protein [Sulfuricurvum sp.]MDD2781857.1 HEPN domain-containing protein [Sulfuricurvum sp.]